MRSQGNQSSMEGQLEPLLGQSRVGQQERKGQRSSAAVDRLFFKRLWHLMWIARCGDCVLLIVLSIASVGIVSQAGLVVGHFYNALLSKNMKLFLGTIWQCLLWYSAETICSATQVWGAEFLAIRWRLRLTQAAHLTYCSSASLSALSEGSVVDNPDERLTNEIICFCQTLSQIMLKTIATPLMILYYTWWVWYHVGWIGPVVIYAFFACGIVVTRWIISPIANLVAVQEKLEAFFRIAHVRFRAHAEAIAMYDSSKCEEAKLDKYLQAALANRKMLVSRHFLLEVNTKAYDYLGAVLNYCVLAIPVFGGVYDTEGSGELANLISNASFAVLQLIYGFSQVMDTAKLVSDVAGYTARVSELFEVLQLLPESKLVPREDPGGLKPKQADLHPASVRLNTPQPSGSESGADCTSVPSGSDLQINRAEYLICSTTCLNFGGGERIEFSIRFAPPSVHEVLGTAFPEVSPSSLLIVCFQCHSPFVQRSKINESVLHMSRIGTVRSSHMLAKSYNASSASIDEGKSCQEILLELGVCVIKRLRSAGHWADTLDPGIRGVLSCMDDFKSNRHDSSSEYDVEASFMLEDPLQRLGKKILNDEDNAVTLVLGHNITKVGSASLVHHPRVGNDPLFGSLFTTAPVKVLQQVLNASTQELVTNCHIEVEFGEETQNQTSQKGTRELEGLNLCKLLPALVVDHVTCFIPGSKIVVVRELTMELQWGDSLLIMGPTGCGKTSFLRVLCNLWPLHSGNIRIPPRLGGKGLLMLPQRPLMANTGLAGQISYPDPPPIIDASSSQNSFHLRRILEAVGLLHILEEVGNDWEVEIDWTTSLSPGEQQLLSLARLFYHQPQLVILDEATSALSEDAEDDIYNRLVNMGKTIISVAHRNRLRRYHSKLLKMLGDRKGSWSLT